MSKQIVYDRILKEAKTLLQKRGFHAFSYRDISNIVGVKTSSIHYYFPTKEDLVREVVVQHKEEAKLMLDALLNEPTKNSKQKLSLFLENIFASTYLKERRMCLGGMLAIDVLTIEGGVQEEIKEFFTMLTQFLKELLSQGKAQGEFSFQGDPQERAKDILAQLEGALLLARLYREEQYLKAAKNQILKVAG